MTKQIDTEIRHITKADDNIFLDLGFDEIEAEKLQSESQRIIGQTFDLRLQILVELIKWKNRNNYSDTDFATKLQISDKKMKYLIEFEYNKFTFDQLFSYLIRLNIRIKLELNQN